MQKIIFFTFYLPLLTACTQSYQNQPGELDSSNWAIKVELKGVENLYRVDKGLYRSAQPSSKGMRRLQALGIETIINLRSFHSDRGKLVGTNLKYLHIACKTWHPEDEDVLEFLVAVTKKNNRPCLVHCMHGADRTGMMCAMYRIVIQGWSKDEAIEEMLYSGYGFHKVWENLIEYIQEVDIDKIKKKLVSMQ